MIKAGIDIFLHYSDQYERVDCSSGSEFKMKLLAKSAVKRVMSSIKSQKNIKIGDSKEFLERFHTLITKGIVLGCETPIVKAGKDIKHGIKVGLEKICSKKDFVFKDTGASCDIDDIYVKSGLIVKDCGDPKYYARQDRTSNIKKYGCRIAFKWESGSELDKWKLQECQPQKWLGYTLEPEKIEEKVDEIFEKINEKEPVVKRDIVKMERYITYLKQKVDLLLAKKPRIGRSYHF